MDRIYLMPIIGTGSSHLDPRRPKYAAEIDAVSGAHWSMADYGREPVALVKATGIDTATHNTIAADATVSTFPLDLTQQIGANLTTVQTALEDRNIPGSNIVPANWTYRQLVRAILILFQFTQRLDGLGIKLFSGGVTLATQWSALGQTLQTALQDMATSLGMNTTGVTGTTTVRQLLKLFYDQWPGQLLFFGNEQW